MITEFYMTSPTMSSKQADQPSFGDPYDILKLSQGASDGEISKAYRKLALRLHPDKQHGKTDQEKEQVAKQFHLVKEARAFLLDDPERRRKYDVQRASRLRRARQEAERESLMSERRKQMIQALARKEAAVRESGTQSATRLSKDEGYNSKTLEKLSKEGRRMREQHSKRADAAEDRAQLKKRKRERDEIANRQVRLKWSRKKIKTSPSEDSLAGLMAQFGGVVEVEMIGGKGNAALVTFADAASCAPCVEKFATSEEMRATFVKRDRDDLPPEGAGEDTEPFLSQEKDFESLSSRQVRQASERERLASRSKPHPTQKQIAFPFEFAATPSGQTASPFELLERFEKQIFSSLGQTNVN